ncbi:MAG TPA: potassium channel protein [Methanosarcinales archaeon]|nr:potassium channel protein [Methanosarcinales archaeon]
MTKELKYCTRSTKDLLIDMKDTSELMLDLAYSAVIYDDREIAMEVIRLEEKMDTLDYYMRISMMLSARRLDEAEALAGVLQAGAAAENISNAAGDIAKIALLDLGIPLELKLDLRGAEETLTRATVSAESPMAGRTLEEIELETETGMWAIAIRRDQSWIYDPDHSTRIMAGDVVFARGHDEGVPLFIERATCKQYQRATFELKRVLADLDRAVDLIVEMKNMSELAVGLAYSAMLFYNKDIADEVKYIEDKMDGMKYELQHWVLESAKHIDEVDQLRGLLHLANASETISDAAYDIADVVLRDIELHPIMAIAVRESDEVVTKREILPGSAAAKKSLGELKLETETGMHIMAVKRKDKWIYSPGARTVLCAGDILIARGTTSGEELLTQMCTRLRPLA